MRIITKILEGGTVDFTQTQKFMLSKDEGKWLTCEVKKPTRSNSQNRLYWLFLNVIERETGNVAYDLHELFKRTLLSPRFITITLNGKTTETKIPASTTKLKKLEFSEYIMKIEAEVGMQCPDPHDVGIMCGRKGCERCEVPDVDYPKSGKSVKF